MGAYMAESFKDLHVGSDIEQLFQYIEDYKPVHLDLEDSGTNLWTAAVAIAAVAIAAVAAANRKFKAQSSSLVVQEEKEYAVCTKVMPHKKRFLPSIRNL